MSTQAADQQGLEKPGASIEKPGASTYSARTPDASSELGSVDAIEVHDDPAAERALTRKIDLHVLPMLTLLYLLSFLDRTNVGNARVQGLATKTHLGTGSAYNVGLALFFVGYAAFEVPANLTLKRFNPRVWLPTLTLVWGAVTMLQALVVNKSGFFAVRFFLGVTEAGLFPGTTFLFSYWYTREQRAVRVAFFFAAAAAAGSLGGILAYGLGHINTSVIDGWQAIFLIEGAITVLVSLVAYAVVPTWPTDSKRFTASEKARLFRRLRLASDSADMEHFNWHGIRSAFTDYKVWLYAFLFHGAAFSLYTISLFLPTIITALGYKAADAQLLTVPVYFLAAIVTLTSAFISQRTGRIAINILLSLSVSLIGYVVIISVQHTAGQYIATFLIACGTYSATGLLLAWPIINVSSQSKRCVAAAIQISVGNCGSIIGVLIYRPQFSKDHYRKAHIITIGFLLLAVFCASTLWMTLKRDNRQRDRLAARQGEEQAEEKPLAYVDQDADSKHSLGDKHPAYRYRY